MKWRKTGRDIYRKHTAGGTGRLKIDPQVKTRWESIENESVSASVVLKKTIGSLGGSMDTTTPFPINFEIQLVMLCN